MRDNSEMKSTMTPVGADPDADHRDEKRWRCSLQRHGRSAARAGRSVAGDGSRLMGRTVRLCTRAANFAGDAWI